MRILQVHNYYKHAGGEDVVVDAERKLLQQHGHEVELCAADNEIIDGPLKSLKAGVQAVWSYYGTRRVAAHIDAFHPDVVHVHNFFPQFSPAIYRLCKRRGAAVVQTLHNFRILCAGGLLLRDGIPCESCVGSSPFPGLVHGCYRESHMATLAPAAMIGLHHTLNSWAHVDAFIALTEFAQSRFIAGGLPEQRIKVKPNFAAHNALARVPGDDRHGALFVGRLSPEKGLRTLVETSAKLDGKKLVVLGDGPLLETCKNAGLDARGSANAAQVRAAMSTAEFLVMPSTWYEGFPLTLVEAFSQSLPVIASRIGSLAELVRDGVTGLLVPPGDANALAAAMRWAFANPVAMAEMGVAARREFERRYTAEANYPLLMDIYDQALKSQTTRTPAHAYA